MRYPKCLVYAMGTMGCKGLDYILRYIYKLGPSLLVFLVCTVLFHTVGLYRSYVANRSNGINILINALPPQQLGGVFCIRTVRTRAHGSDSHEGIFGYSGSV